MLSSTKPIQNDYDGESRDAATVEGHRDYISLPTRPYGGAHMVQTVRHTAHAYTSAR